MIGRFLRWLLDLLFPAAPTLPPTRTEVPQEDVQNVAIQGRASDAIIAKPDELRKFEATDPANRDNG